MRGLGSGVLPRGPPGHGTRKSRHLQTPVGLGPGHDIADGLHFDFFWTARLLFSATCRCLQFVVSSGHVGGGSQGSIVRSGSLVCGTGALECRVSFLWLRFCGRACFTLKLSHKKCHACHVCKACTSESAIGYRIAWIRTDHWIRIWLGYATARTKRVCGLALYGINHAAYVVQVPGRRGQARQDLDVRLGVRKQPRERQAPQGLGRRDP